MEQMVLACKSGAVPMDVACVIVSKPTAEGMEKAHKLGIPDQDIVVVSPAHYKLSNGAKDPVAFGEALIEELQKRDVTVVTQNGWLPLTPKSVIEAYPGMFFNQHPGNPSVFGGEGMYGRRVHAAALLYHRMTDSNPWTYPVAQRVHPEFDRGAVVRAEKVDILPTDTVDDLQERVLPVEHKLQIELLRDIASGNVVEMETDTFFVDPHQKALALAKKLAVLLYPKG